MKPFRDLQKQQQVNAMLTWFGQRKTFERWKDEQDELTVNYKLFI